MAKEVIALSSYSWSHSVLRFSGFAAFTASSKFIRNTILQREKKGKRGQKGEREEGGGDLPELYSLLLPEYVLIPTPLEEITEATDASSPTSSVHLRERERERKARSEGKKNQGGARRSELT